MVQVEAMIKIVSDFDEYHNDQDQIIEICNNDFLMTNVHVQNYMKMILADPQRYYHVENLNFSESKINFLGLRELQLLFFAPFQAHRLYIREIDLKSKEIKWLAHMISHSCLDHLELSITTTHELDTLVQALCSPACRIQTLIIDIGEESMNDHAHHLYASLATVLERNTSIHMLKVVGYPIAVPQYIIGFANALAHNQSLQCLEITGANMSESSAKYIIDALKINTTLTKLDVSNNTIHSARIFLDMIKNNRVIEDIHYSYGLGEGPDRLLLQNTLKQNKERKGLVVSKMCSASISNFFLAKRLQKHLIWQK